MTALNNKKDERIVIRCTTEEKKNLQKLCDEEGINMTSFFLLCMREASKNGINLHMEIPNTLTAKTIIGGALSKSFSSVDELMDDLNA